MNCSSLLVILIHKLDYIMLSISNYKGIICASMYTGSHRYTPTLLALCHAGAGRYKPD